MQTRTCNRSLFVLTALFTLAASVLSSHASAQELGESSNISLSIERLFGFYVGHESVDHGPTTTKTDFTDISVAWNQPPTPLTMPRLALDYFIDEHFTLGGSFGLYSATADVGPGDTNVTGILFAVRGGYALRLTHAITFWPRAGFSYTSLNSDVNALDRHMLALGLEGMFTLSPADGWAILVGPSIDLGFTGQVAHDDASENSFGIMAGLLGYFGT